MRLLPLLLTGCITSSLDLEQSEPRVIGALDGPTATPEDAGVPDAEPEVDGGEAINCDRLGVGAECSLQHASGVCSGGRCVPSACADGWNDTDNDLETGCERGCDPLSTAVARRLDVLDAPGGPPRLATHAGAVLTAWSTDEAELRVDLDGEALETSGVSLGSPDVTGDSEGWVVAGVQPMERALTVLRYPLEGGAADVQVLPGTHAGAAAVSQRNGRLAVSAHAAVDASLRVWQQAGVEGAPVETDLEGAFGQVRPALSWLGGNSLVLYVSGEAGTLLEGALISAGGEVIGTLQRDLRALVGSVSLVGGELVALATVALPGTARMRVYRIEPGGVRGLTLTEVWGERREEQQLDANVTRLSRGAVLFMRTLDAEGVPGVRGRLLTPAGDPLGPALAPLVAVPEGFANLQVVGAEQSPVAVWTAPTGVSVGIYQAGLLCE